MVECAKEQHQYVIRFLWSEGVKTGEIYGRMSVQYGDNCMRRREVYVWVERFGGGRRSVDNDSRSGRPTTVNSVEVK
jgi:hypothetical protein